MDEFLQNLLYAVITTILPIIVAYGVSYLKTKKEEKLQLIDNTYVKETINTVVDTIINVVNTVSQTYVSDLKKDGKFDVEKQKIALNKAVEQAKELINEESKEIIQSKYNDLDSYIRSIIESYIISNKK
jgi:ribonuclease PH